MDDFDSINYLQEKVEVIQKSLSDVNLPSTDNDNDIIDSIGSSTEISISNSDKVDSIKSCESILKIFSFEPREFNERNEKCLEFWNLINNHPEIQPINCVIMDAQNNKRDEECQTDQKETEASLWIRALYELKKKKLHHVAMVTSKNTCKYCQEPEDSYEVTKSDSLSELDKFHPPCTSVLGNPPQSDLSSSSHSSKQDKIESTDVDSYKSEDLTPYYSTKKELSRATVERRSRSLIPQPGVTIVYHELVEKLSLALRNIEQQKQARSTEEHSEPSYKLNLSDQTSLSSKGVTNDWKKPPSKVPQRMVDKRCSIKKVELEKAPEELSVSSGKGEESSDTTKMKAKDEKKQKAVRENYTYTQRALSLLHIDVDEYNNSTVQERTKLLQDALKENYSKFVKKDLEEPPLCPCTKELQERTKSYCSCEPGVCKITKELEEADLKDLAKYIPYGQGLECVKLMLEGLKKIRSKDLTLEQTAVEVQKLLKSVQNRDVEGSPCKCPLHKISLRDVEEKLGDAKYIKDLLYENFEKALNVKYGEKLGINLEEVKEQEVQHDEIDVDNDFSALTSKKSTRICIMCGKSGCNCRKSKSSMKFLDLI